MKAILFRKHGDARVLEYADLPTPEPKKGEVLVRLHAASLNRLDIWVRNGWPGIKLDLPHIPGADGAGFVSALGEDVEDWKIDDPVVINPNLGCGECDHCLAGKDNLCKKWKLLGETIPGTYCEYIALPQRQLFKLPQGFDFHIAAAAALVFETAWHSLVNRANIQSDQIVLIVGAAGGVNTASISIAKYFGCKVIVIGSNAEKLKIAGVLGADILINRNSEPDWAKSVFKATNSQGADIIVDNVGITYPLSFRAASKGGKILTVGNTGGPKFEIDNRYIFSKHLSLLGSTMGTSEDFAQVMNLVAQKKLLVVLDKSFPLQEAHLAQERLESNLHLGKITLEI